MRYAIIQDRKVVNIVEAESPLPGLTMLPATSTTFIGSTLDDSGNLPPEPVPPTPEEEQALAEQVRQQDKQRAVMVRLEDIDQKSTRPLRAMLTNTATEEDKTMLAALEDEAAALREELRGILTAHSASDEVV